MIPAGSLAAPSAAVARAPETATVLEAMDSGTVPRAAVEALLAKATAGDTEAAAVAGRLFDRALGVRWDPPTALRWYTAAALGGSDSAIREAQRLWRGMPPVSQRRAEALLARYFTDTELASIKIGPVRRPTTQRSWMTHLNGAEFPVAPPQTPVIATTPAVAVATIPLLPSSAPTPPAIAAPPITPAAIPPAPASAIAPAAITAPPPVVLAPEARIPRPAVKPSQPGPIHDSVVVASNTPVPGVKPKR
ncbi:hypothetical protein N825_02760 [Skermanella stibiiresistens SB22]|uniref:Uncharacterized protein n=2 Tax=Skermanella TaxID=204447 RepID=W9H178_9PROT|nr:hypothetical protein N825_02760 [Skermanella stibiiresistens SB22]